MLLSSMENKTKTLSCRVLSSNNNNGDVISINKLCACAYRMKTPDIR